MGFHEVDFPQDIGYGTSGGPGFSTEIIETDSGAEQRIANWSVPRHQWNAAYAIRSYAQLQVLKNFFAARLGSANGFRFKDFFDFTSHVDGKSAHTKDDVSLGSGDAIEDQFQLVKKYGVTPVRTFKVTKPVNGTVLIAFDGTLKTLGADYTVNDATGIVLFTTIPGVGVVVTAGYEFDKPVRFAEDVGELLAASYDNFGSGSISEIPLIELIDEVPISDEFYFGNSDITSPMSANLTLVELNGRVQIFDPNASGLKVFLPPVLNLPTGGPWFYLGNISDPTTGENLSIRDDDSVEIGILVKGGAMEIWLGLSDATTKKWYGLT